MIRVVPATTPGSVALTTALYRPGKPPTSSWVMRRSGVEGESEGEGSPWGDITFSIRVPHLGLSAPRAYRALIQTVLVRNLPHRMDGMDQIGANSDSDVADTLVYDSERVARIGLPEAVLCLNKDTQDVVRIVEHLWAADVGPVLFTRMSEQQWQAVTDRVEAVLAYDALSQTAFLNGTLDKRDARVGIVTAGTSDRRVAHEAARTLHFLGIEPRLHIDVGVAGLWRLLQRVDNLRRQQALIVVAGMDAALASVVGGLVACPVIAVPTSTGYGAARGGETALHAMLASCAQGVVVTNIDNGYGAACAAARIVSTP